MSQFVKTRVRCPLEPAKVGEQFKTLTGSTPKIFKGAGCEFELALFDGSGLFDVANVASFTVSVRALNGGSVAMLKTVARPDINTTLNIGQWNNGTDQHVVVPFLGTETAIAAGTWDITVSGFTDDNVVDPDVFAISKLEVIDAGIVGLVAPVIDPNVGVTLQALQGLLAGYVPFVVPKGKLITFQDDGATWRRTMGLILDAQGNPVRVDSLEQQ